MIITDSQVAIEDYLPPSNPLPSVLCMSSFAVSRNLHVQHSPTLHMFKPSRFFKAAWAIPLICSFLILYIPD